MLTYHIITIGCQMNLADSERVASVLERRGYKRVDDKHLANLVVINTCGVRQSAENRIYGLIPRIKERNGKTKIILTGCLAERKDVKRRLKDYVDVWLPINKISNFQFPISKIPLTPFMERAKHDDYLSIKPKYNFKYSAFVPIGNGCDNFCSYCVVPYARGGEVYRRSEEILAEVRGLVRGGYKEIVLIAQNVNSYKSITRLSPAWSGRSGRLDFANLLKMVNEIKGDFWIRFFTSHPKDMSKKLIKALADCKKVCHQIHLPAQAGDDEILERMNRQYTAAEYVKLINKIRKQLNPPRPPLLKRAIWNPPVAITTDVIVGFPGETKKQFNQTVKLFKLVKFDLAYISKYSPRPGTAAFKLPDNISRQEKADRAGKLDKILRRTALANNKKYIGKTVRVLVENKTKTGEWFGKTATGKDIRFLAKRSVCQVGNFVKVKITQVKEFCLAGILN